MVVLSTSLAHSSACSAVIAYSFEPTKIVLAHPLLVDLVERHLAELHLARADVGHVLEL